MSQSLAKNRPSTSVNRKSFNPRERDDSPNFTTQNSPRTSNASFYGSQNINTAASSGNVKVVCRVRPFNQREVELNGVQCVECEDEKTISIKTSQYVDGGSGALSFTYDRVFDMNAHQEEVYEFAAKPVVESVLEGFNGTVFAYGQTSSGKTYTMMGPDIDEGELCGVIPRMVATVFDYISETPDHIEFTVKVSIIEIYMERIRDLLNPKKVNLKVREDKTRGIYIEDVTESYVSDEKDVYDFLKYGHSNRATTTTNMNESSSRSHCIFMMTIHQNNLLEMSAKTGKLYLVDLAGSEKVAKTGAIGQVLEEAKEINKSLSALGNVINALTDNRGHQHIPYRDSKLTRILQESLGGNSRTSLIINCSPSSFNENETISALRFGYRAKSIKNTPKINREFTAAQLQVLLEKAEKKIVIRDKKIRSLEGLLSDHGIAAPNDFADLQGWEHQTPNRKSAYKNSDHYENEDETLDAYLDRGDESLSKLDMMSPERGSLGNQYERIKALENELRIERLSLSKQTEKVKLLKKDLTENNTKMMLIEKENEALINKLATMTLKTQELEEKFRDKEMKLEILQLLKDVLMTENEELKKSRQLFLNDLDEENNEIMRIAQKQGLIPAGSIPGKNLPPQKEKDLMNSAIMQEVNKNKESYFALVDELVKEMVRDMTQRFGIRNIQSLKDLTVPYVDKLKEAFQVQNELTFRRSRGAASGESSDEMRRKYDKLREELALEKQKTTQIKTDYEKVIKEYDNLVKNNIPSFEEWKQGIIDSTPIEESIDAKDDTLIFREFSNRNSKESKFATANNNCDFSKDKKKDVRFMEPQIETSLGLEHYIATPQGTTPSGGDKKSPVKTQRMINLEKQLHETKELVNQYKNKIESLKSLITTNPSSTSSAKYEEPEKFENTETFKHHKQIIKQEVLDQVSNKKGMGGMSVPELSPRSANNAKIVKPIKGGQNKKPAAGNTGYIDVLKQQYRYNKSFVNSIGEGILNKKQGSIGNKNALENKPKFG